MLTDGKLNETKFSGTGSAAFKSLAREIQRADAARGKGLRQTQAARAANRAKRDAKGGAR